MPKADMICQMPVSSVHNCRRTLASKDMFLKAQCLHPCSLLWLGRNHHYDIIQSQSFIVYS